MSMDEMITTAVETNCNAMMALLGQDKLEKFRVSLVIT